MNDHKASHAVDKLEDQGVGLFDEAKVRISDLTDEARARGEKLIGQVTKRGQEFLDDAQDRGTGALKDIQTLIQKNPWKAVGYALAAGAVLYAFYGKSEDK